MNGEHVNSNTLNNVDTEITDRSEDNENNENHGNDRKVIMMDMMRMIRFDIAHIGMIIRIAVETMRRNGITIAMGRLIRMKIIELIKIMGMITLIRMIMMRSA